MSDTNALDDLKNEIQKDIVFHTGEVNRFKRYNKVWQVLIVVLALSNGVFGQFADTFNNSHIVLGYKLWILLLPCVMSINAIFDSKIQIDENQRLCNEKRNLLIQIRSESLKPAELKEHSETFYEQTAEALEIINRGARN